MSESIAHLNESFVREFLKVSVTIGDPDTFLIYPLGCFDNRNAYEYVGHMLVDKKYSIEEAWGEVYKVLIEYFPKLDTGEQEGLV